MHRGSATHHAEQPVQEHKAEPEGDDRAVVHQGPRTHVQEVSVRNGQQSQLRQQNRHHLHRAQLHEAYTGSELSWSGAGGFYPMF
jgi:hypothetical protein